MASRKRTSDTTINLQSQLTNNKPKLRVRIQRFHAVARWTWNAGDGDEVCGICQSSFEGVAPGVKYPGDECPVVWGKCGHAFHLQCVSKWLEGGNNRNTCPICRADWEFGADEQSQNRQQQEEGAEERQEESAAI